MRRGTAIFVAPGVSHGYEMGDDLVVYNCFLRVEAAQFDLPWVPRDGRLGRLFGPRGLAPRTAGRGDARRGGADRVSGSSRRDPGATRW